MAGDAMAKSYRLAKLLALFFARRCEPSHAIFNYTHTKPLEAYILSECLLS